MTVTTTHSQLTATEKRHWWVTNRKIVDKYMKDARSLIATQEESEIVSALNLVDAALAISPRLDQALELRARSLLYLGRFKDVADMLQDYIPSLRIIDTTSSSSSQNLSREGLNLLSRETTFNCFSVSDLKKKVMAGLCKTCHNKEGHWRYLVLGEACCHLGLMEDAMLLLQTGKRLATAAFRQQSVCWSDDSFSPSTIPLFGPTTPPRAHLSVTESVTQLLSHIKFLLRRRTAAFAALDAGLYSEAIRHLSKILDGRRPAPQGFLAECYMHRASVHRSAGRIAESIADCNRTLALDPTNIQALETRASLFETIRCLPESLHDLEHLKLLYNTILRDRKLPGPAWKRHNVRYREIPGKLCPLTTRIQEVKRRLGSGEKSSVDYYGLIGVRRGCSRSELERAHLLLSLRHKPDKSSNFIERCELADERDVESVKERARMSALLLYRLIQKGYTSVMGIVLDEEAAEKLNNNNKKKKKNAASAAAIQVEKTTRDQAEFNKSDNNVLRESKPHPSSSVNNPGVFQGVSCRDLAVVGNLLSQVGYNRPIPVKYEALSC